MFDTILSTTGDINQCVFQVGDHHPDLHVWNLYHNHEVRIFFFPLLYFPSFFAAGELHQQGLFYFAIRFNRSLYARVESQCSRVGQPCLSLRRSTAVGSVTEGDNDMVPLKPGRETISRPSNTVCCSLNESNRNKIELEHVLALHLSGLCLFSLLFPSFHPPFADSAAVAGQDSAAALADEALNLHPHQLSFSEASVHLLIPQHCPCRLGYDTFLFAVW